MRPCEVTGKLRSQMIEYLRILRFGIMPVLVAVILQGQAARAAQQLVLVSDQTQIVKLPEAPATVVVGNPAIADVTTEGSSLFFHPRGFGVTNVLALDAEGKKLADYQVRVVFEDSYSVSMYAPGGRETYSCRRDCEPMMRLGDDTGFLTNYAAQVSAKNNLASHQAMGEYDGLQPRGSTVITTYGTEP